MRLRNLRSPPAPRDRSMANRDQSPRHGENAPSSQMDSSELGPHRSFKIHDAQPESTVKVHTPSQVWSTSHHSRSLLAPPRSSDPPPSSQLIRNDVADTATGNRQTSAVVSTTTVPAAKPHRADVKVGTGQWKHDLMISSTWVAVAQGPGRTGGVPGDMDADAQPRPPSASPRRAFPDSRPRCPPCCRIVFPAYLGGSDRSVRTTETSDQPQAHRAATPRKDLVVAGPPGNANARSMPPCSAQSSTSRCPYSIRAVGKT
jgi:hypothetical protein